MSPAPPAGFSSVVPGLYAGALDWGVKLGR